MASIHTLFWKTWLNIRVTVNETTMIFIYNNNTLKLSLSFFLCFNSLNKLGIAICKTKKTTFAENFLIFLLKFPLKLLCEDGPSCWKLSYKDDLILDFIKTNLGLNNYCFKHYISRVSAVYILTQRLCPTRKFKF